ncbi:MAG TPA: RyR domain-containing protein [Caulobacteraceae bacterium]
MGGEGGAPATGGEQGKDGRGREGLFPFQLVWVIPVAAVATVALGTWGWLAQHKPLDESLYRALALFEINNDSYSTGQGLADWHFRIGRWTGAGAVISGLLAAAALLHEHLATALARWTRQAVVVIGAGPMALGAFETARRRGRSALWLGAPAFGSASLGGIALQWPAGSRPRAVADHVRGAGHVLVTGADDAEALALARAARTGAPEAFITVLMTDARLAEDAAGTLNDARTRVLATGAVAARALHHGHPPFQIAHAAGQARIHALLVGFGAMGQAVFQDLVVNCRTTGLTPPRLTVIDPKASALEGVLRVRAPELDACAEAAFIDGEIGGRAVRPGPAALGAVLAAGGPITCAYICLADDAAALSAASMLQSLFRALDLGHPPIFVRLRAAGALAVGALADGAAASGREGLDALTPFGDAQDVLEASEFLSDQPDAAARAYHEAYRASLAPALRDDPANRAAFGWERLDETYRQANRDAVAHIPAKLASAGIDPARWQGAPGLPRLGPGERLYHGPADLERLAELEHERWNAQRRMDGWRRTDAPKKDEPRRLHPSLKAYAALTDEVKEYDRVFIRQTQVICGGGAQTQPHASPGPRQTRP